MIFLEALRQFQFKVGQENIMFVHVSLVPQLGSDHEQKTKPTQHSVKELRSLGLSPDVVVCRSGTQLSTSTVQKMSIFCQVPTGNVISVYDVSNIYHVPLILLDQSLNTIIRDRLKINSMLDTPEFKQWSDMAHIVDTATDLISIAIVGKYTGLQDSYASLIKSVKHSAIHLNMGVDIQWIEASHLEAEMESEDPVKFQAAWSTIRATTGVIVAGGFGIRGVEGKILAAKYCRENKKPYLGICLGMQVMVIEYARHVLGRVDANSAEFDEQTSYPAVIFMPEINTEVMGGTMRLGTRPTVVSDPSSLAFKVYGFEAVQKASDNDDQNFKKTRGEYFVNERHRHRYEVNPEKIQELESHGLVFSGKDDLGERMEIVELSAEVHPFYFGTQFHPEFKSRPNRPSPPFFAFMAVCASKRDKMAIAGKWRIAHDKREMRRPESLLQLSPNA